MFFDQWMKFLENLEELCRHRLRQPGRENYEELTSLLRNVISELQSDDAAKAMEYAIITAERNDDDKKIVGFLEDELKFFNNLVVSSRDDAGGLTLNVEATKDALGSGETVKDSIEGFFELPRWLKKILKVLNELLSIIRGGK
jgi:hypothetical protein